jgi:hypothetical protein
MTHDGSPYVPPAGTILICTVKRNAQDDDSSALFQKVLGVGMTVAGSVALVEVYPADTANTESDRDGYYGDIQAQDTSGAVTTVWLAKLVFAPDVTRKLTTSVPIYTANPPQGGNDPTPSFMFFQSTPSDLWIINHNLGVVVATTVFDTAGNEIEAEISNPSLNQTRIAFTTPTAGKARCQ